MRQDLQLLADYGVIKTPGQTWPRPWAEIAEALGQQQDADADDLPKYVVAALSRVRSALTIAKETNRLRLTAEIGAARNPTRLRTFGDSPREQGEGALSIALMGDQIAGRLRVTGAARPADGKRVRFDGSYGALLIGNWYVSAGYVDRWFGPGQDGSTIFSSNARPVPSLSIDRNHADAFQSPWLSWIGPWRFSMSYGLMEDPRTPEKTHLITMRATARPFESLELGVTRVVMWCGKGRPCGVRTFKNALFGNESQLQANNNPGNQLASFEFRYRLRRDVAPLAIYGMLTAEDSISPSGGLGARGALGFPDIYDYLPKRQLVQVGAETWGAIYGVPFRAHLEFADTVCRYSDPNPAFGCAYEHFIYTTGYRYRGRPIGHALDGDGQMLSIGATVLDDHGDPWTALVRSVELNKAGQNTGNTLSKVPAKLYNFEFSHEALLNIGKVQLGVGYDRASEGGAKDRLRANATWTASF